MGYDRGDSFPFDFDPNGNPYVSKSKENCHHVHIPFYLKVNRNLVSSVREKYMFVITQKKLITNGMSV